MFVRSLDVAEQRAKTDPAEVPGQPGQLRMKRVRCIDDEENCHVRGN
jgi:hypothetical protein